MYSKSIWPIALQSYSKFNLQSYFAQNLGNPLPCSNFWTNVAWRLQQATIAAAIQGSKMCNCFCSCGMFAEKTQRHPKPILSSPAPHPLVPGAHARVPPQPGRQPTVPLAASGLCQLKLLPIWLLHSTARGRWEERKQSQRKSTMPTWWKWEPRWSWCPPRAERSRPCDCSDFCHPETRHVPPAT